MVFWERSLKLRALLSKRSCDHRVDAGDCLGLQRCQEALHRPPARTDLSPKHKRADFENALQGG